MMRLRTKLYFILTGFYAGFTLIGAASHALYITVLGFAGTIFSWYMAAAFFEQDLNTFLESIKDDKR